ncbi:hypothetical protein EOC94_17865 [Mesorhizobium sp. M6A.T.Ce.TU.016.01.1.1]|nr:hypothetical protein EOC94_17865 [Mesorhizobium sp. M6A.T.Ce.TU.016.01.1.1]
MPALQMKCRTSRKNGIPVAQNWCVTSKITSTASKPIGRYTSRNCAWRSWCHDAPSTAPSSIRLG